MSERTIDRFNRLVIPVTETGCYLWTGGDDGRYGRFKLEGKQMVSHRAAWILSGRMIPDGMVLCHKCDVPRCVNVDHLFLGTMKDNTTDMFRKGRQRQLGERHLSAKLSAVEVVAIRTDKRSSRVLSEVYGVNRSLIVQIKRRRIWKSVA